VLAELPEDIRNEVLAELGEREETTEKTPEKDIEKKKMANLAGRTRIEDVRALLTDWVRSVAETGVIEDDARAVEEFFVACVAERNITLCDRGLKWLAYEDAKRGNHLCDFIQRLNRRVNGLVAPEFSGVLSA